MVRRVKVGQGQSAPDFELVDQDRNAVRLRDLRGHPVVLYFYPKDFTRGCTAEAVGFCARFDAFRRYGTQIVGVSADDVASHRRFAERHALPYRLLADPGGRVHARYGVGRTLGVVPRRVTFVIGADGTVLRRIASQLRPARHVREAVDALEADARRTGNV